MTVVGIILIVSAALGISCVLTREAMTEIIALEAALNLIAFIRQNIDSFSSPVDVITTSWTYKEPCIGEFCNSVREDGLETAIKKELLPFSKEAEDDLTAFAENVGKGYRDEEVKRCDYYISRFEGYLASEREKFENRKPLYRYIPALGAASIIILVI